ncbi:hypothetical protein ABT023_18790 [Micromonospora sp. NPDC002296]|uniref:hypothetical protein n=1 Tax=Micromonospora sp. NPDC002296 TaxID=3154271 RepID=UPI00331757C3
MNVAQELAAAMVATARRRAMLAGPPEEGGQEEPKAKRTARPRRGALMGTLPPITNTATARRRAMILNLKESN